MVVLAAALIVGVTLLAGRPVDGAPRNAATALVGTDGHHELMSLTGAAREVRTLEWAHVPYAQAFGAGPLEFSQVAPIDNVLRRYWVRLTTTVLADGAKPRPGFEELRELSADGLRTWVIKDPQGSIQFSPGRLDLPADVHAGSSWNEQGSIRQTRGTRTTTGQYQLASRASAAGAGYADGCLRVDQTLTGSAGPQTSSNVWCPGRGIVSQTGDAQTWSPIGEFPQWADPRATVQVAATPAWTNPAAWQFRAHAEALPAPLALTQRTDPQLVAPDLYTIGMRVGGTLMGVGLASGRYFQSWRARPGGDITLTGGFGQVTIVATSARRLAAYTETGQWLWTGEIPDVAQAAMVRLDAERFLVATLDGTVSARSIRTGVQLWSRSTSTELRIPPVVSDGHVVVADQSGSLSAYTLEGQPEWQAQLANRPSFLAAAGGVVLATSNSSSVSEAFRLTDGALWVTAYSLEEERQIVPVGPLIWVRTDDAVVALDPNTGRWRWRSEVALATLVSDGTTALGLAADHAYLFGPGGETVKRWDVQLADGAPNGLGASWSAQRIIITDRGKRVTLGTTP